uniref:NADH-ubiquinone oxidoreductase chain 4 n=1 Tax=Xenorhina sp. TNHC-GDC 31177 TaxID=1933077 RepID=A0A343VTH7_9NEOB|nr:NADH dehydrogenase subunit 4 [Xenorhina sp. TNHC-GDC 31177]
MLMVIYMWSSILPTIFIMPQKLLWSASTTQGFMISLFSIMWFFQQDFSFSNHLFLIDELSAPLAILTCWLFPLTLMASQSKLSKEPNIRQRLFIANVTLLQLMTLLAFTASDLMYFFIFFEASLIPTMIIITRWGSQEHRLEAGVYLIFYTMIGAAPLITFLMTFYLKFGSLSSPLINLTLTNNPKPYYSLFWTTCNLAFLMKLPLYCLHLWLPKAHVEAPVAGSMVLAATMLKLGGYGLMRFSTLLMGNPMTKLSLLMLIASTGIIATTMLCMRQTDLKSMIAMSSVSHMNLIIAAALIQTKWSYNGAMLMMIAHGLTSSALFCLANTIYERTNSRTMILLRGIMLILPLAGFWWLIMLLFNMALPPTVNFYAELMIMASIYKLSTLIFLLIATNIVFTAAYTLYTLWSTQWGLTPKHLKTLSPFQIREHLILFLHTSPAILLINYPSLICT